MSKIKKKHKKKFKKKQLIRSAFEMLTITTQALHNIANHAEQLDTDLEYLQAIANDALSMIPKNNSLELTYSR